MHRFRVSALLAIGLLMLGLAACNDDDCPTCPEPPEAPIPSMGNVWPHADGTAWTYAGHYQEFHPTAPPLAMPPYDTEIPAMEILHEALQTPMGLTPQIEIPYFWQLTRDGEVTTQSGVTADYIRETMYVPEGGGPVKSVSVDAAPDRLLALIARARPDLRPALDSAAKVNSLYGAPQFLAAYAFAFEDTGYYGYGDVDQLHSWAYLVDSINVGTEFTQQLVPSLADNVWLNGRVWSHGDVTVNGVTFHNAVEVMYVLDFGLQDVTDEGGNLLGTIRSYGYGTIFFVPEVGPVMSLERMNMMADPALIDGGGLLTDLVLEMVSLESGQ